MITPFRTKIASSASASTACCLASTFGSKLTDLMSHRDQRTSGTVITDDPRRRSACGSAMGLAMTYTVGAVPLGGN